MPVVQAKILHCANVFVGEVDAGNSLVTGGERNRYVVGKIDWQRVLLAGYAQDDVVAGEFDLDRDVMVRKLLEQGICI